MTDWLRLENGMVRGGEREYHKETRRDRCAHCGMEQEDVRFLHNGDGICPDCLPAYLEEKAGDYAEAFIGRHEREYYVAWWFGGLDPAQKLSLIKAIYWQQAGLEVRLGADPSFAADRVEFCLLHPYYPEFALERLS